LKQQITAEERKTIKEVHEEVEEEEDGHLYHSYKGLEPRAAAGIPWIACRSSASGRGKAG
jgi:hypothetical protein